MQSLKVAMIILLSRFVLSQSPDQSRRRVILGPRCSPNAPHRACCPQADVFPRACIPFDPHDPRCSDLDQWRCCVQLEGGHFFPGSGGYTHHGVQCKKVGKYLWGTQKQTCPAPDSENTPASGVTNPFQPFEDFLNSILQKEEKFPSEGDEGSCQNPDPDSNLESFLPSPELSDLSPIADDDSNDVSESLFSQDEDVNPGLLLTDQDAQNDVTMDMHVDPIPILSAQSESGSDDLINTNVDYSANYGDDYDAFLEPHEAVGDVNNGQTNFDDLLFTDQDIFDDNADPNQISRT